MRITRYALGMMALVAVVLGARALVDNGSAEAARSDPTTAPVSVAAEHDSGTSFLPLSLVAGVNLVGWIGLPTSSTTILDGNSDITTVWVFDSVWFVDASILPRAGRTPILIAIGDGVFLITSRATTLMVPTSTSATQTLGVFQDETGAIAADFGTPVDGEVTLKRTLTGLSATFTIAGLTPGNTYTAWIVIFNNPAGCIDGCDETDLGNAAAEASVANGDGLIADATGSATFNATVVVGDFGHHQVVFGDGVTDPLGAEVHTVLRNHGPQLADASEVIEQTSILAGGCTAESSVDGTGTGPFACWDPFLTVFMP